MGGKNTKSKFNTKTSLEENDDLREGTGRHNLFRL